MTKQTLKFKENDFNDEVESYSILLPLVGNLIAAYNSMQLPELVNNDVSELLSNPQAFIYDKMTMGDQIELHGFKIDRNKAFDLLEKPDGHDNLVNAIDSIKAQPNYVWHLSNYDLVNGEAVLKPALIAQIRERHTLYATNAEHLKAFNFAQAVISAAAEYFGDGAIDIPSIVQKFVEPQPSNFQAVGVRPYQLRFEEIATFRDPR